MTVGEALSRVLCVKLGPDDPGLLAGVSVLAGDAVESLFPRARAAGHDGPFRLFACDGWLLGAASVTVETGFETAVFDLYRGLLRVTHGRHLARIWNYVPAINAVDAAGLENYRRFCRARAIAFEQHHGERYKAFVPAASAVGCDAATLTLVFAACAAVPRHFENPLQVPAYDYPSEYGPRAPSFARATIVRTPPDAATVFVSGTSAIRGHATVAPHRTREQLECTLENLRAISEACGLGRDFGGGETHGRAFKVFLRNAADQPAVAAALNERLLNDGDTATYLRADICRAELNVEIEAALWPRRPRDSTGE